MKKETLKALLKDRDMLVKAIKEKLKEAGKMDKELQILNRKINHLQGEPKAPIDTKDAGYDANMVLRKKILYVLKKLKGGTIKEITDYIIKEEKNKSYEKLYPQVQQAALKLFNQDILSKIGEYNAKYIINKK